MLYSGIFLLDGVDDMWGDGGGVFGQGHGD
jgi:hypothetical protein